MAFVEIDDHLFDRFQELAVCIAREQHLGPRDAQFETLTPHGLDENPQLKLAAASDLE